MNAHHSGRQPSGCACCLGIALFCLAVDAASIYAAIRLAMLVTGAVQ